MSKANRKTSLIQISCKDLKRVSKRISTDFDYTKQINESRNFVRRILGREIDKVSPRIIRQSRIPRHLIDAEKEGFLDIIKC